MAVQAWMQCTRMAPTTLRPTVESTFAGGVSPASPFISARVGIGMVSVVAQPCGHSTLRPVGWVFMLQPPGFHCDVAQQVGTLAGGARGAAPAVGSNALAQITA